MGGFSPGSDAERIAFAGVGALVLGGAVALMLLAGLEAHAGGPKNEFTDDLLSEGHADAVANSIWRAFGVRLSAVVLALVDTPIASGALWLDLPKRVLVDYLVVVDAVELLGYGLLTLLCVVVVLGGIRSGKSEDVTAGLFFLVLWGIGITIGFAFGLLDGWIAILTWTYGVVA